MSHLLFLSVLVLSILASVGCVRVAHTHTFHLTHVAGSVYTIPQMELNQLAIDLGQWHDPFVYGAELCPKPRHQGDDFVGGPRAMYYVKGDQILIASDVPGHLSYVGYLLAKHEAAHQDEILHHLPRGSSHLWEELATMPGGQMYLTHPDINKVLRDKGFKAPL